ncbi:Zinc finger BED domain-containing protein DAYSLEEPER [Bienertia sinuspersici]
MMNRIPAIDCDVFREMLSIAVVKHDLSFQFAEYSGIRKCFSYINPEVKLVSRNTLKADVLKMFKREKEKLRDELNAIRGRISLTSDCWTSITTDGYMSLTAHFVDNQWVLQKRILNFRFCLRLTPVSICLIMFMICLKIRAYKRKSCVLLLIMLHLMMCLPMSLKMNLI